MLIVDNASTDASVEMLKNNVSVTSEWLAETDMELTHAEHGGTRLEIIETGMNGGYGYGNNFGMRYAKEKLGAKYALIVNPDVEFNESAVYEMTSLMRVNDKIAIAAPMCKLEGTEGEAAIPGSRKNSIAGAPAYPLRTWFMDLLASGPVCRRLFWKKLFYNEEKYKGVASYTTVDIVPGSMLLVDIRKILGLMGFDENVFLYEEEYILARKTKNAGYVTALLLNETYLHKHPPVTRETIRKNKKHWLRKQKQREKSTLYYFEKYLEASKHAINFSKFFFWIVKMEIRLQ